MSSTEPLSDSWSQSSPAPSSPCYPPSVSILCLLTHQNPTTGTAYAGGGAACCILGKILPLFPFLIGTSMVSCLEFAREICWANTGEGVLSIDCFSQETSPSSLMGCFFWRLDLEQVHLFMTACPSCYSICYGKNLLWFSLKQTEVWKLSTTKSCLMGECQK